MRLNNVYTICVQFPIKIIIIIIITQYAEHLKEKITVQYLRLGVN